MAIRPTLLTRAATALAITALVLGGLAGVCVPLAAGTSDVLTAPRPVHHIEAYAGTAHAATGIPVIQRLQVWLAFAAIGTISGSALCSARQLSAGTGLAPSLRFSPLRI